MAKEKQIEDNAKIVQMGESEDFIFAPDGESQQDQDPKMQQLLDIQQKCKELIVQHKQLLKGAEDLKAEYENKMAALSNQSLILVGSIRAFNSLLPSDMQIND